MRCIGRTDGPAVKIAYAHDARARRAECGVLRFIGADKLTVGTAERHADLCIVLVGQKQAKALGKIVVA